jgi:hypothetical protein
LEEKKLLSAVIFCLCCFFHLFAADNTAADIEFAKNVASSELSRDGIEFAEEILEKSKLDLEKTFKSAKSLEFLVGKTIPESEGCQGFVAQKGEKVTESIYTDSNYNRTESNELHNFYPNGMTPLNGSSSMMVVFVSFSISFRVDSPLLCSAKRIIQNLLNTPCACTGVVYCHFYFHRH